MVAVKERSDFGDGEDKILLVKYEVLSNFDEEYLKKRGGQVLLGCRTEITKEIRVPTNEGLKTENEIFQRNRLPKPLIDVSIFQALDVLIDHNLKYHIQSTEKIHRIDLVFDTETYELKTIAREIQ